MKFPIPASIGYVTTTQVTVWQCHLYSFQLMGNTKVLTDVLAIERSLVVEIPLDHLDHKDDLFKP